MTIYYVYYNMYNVGSIPTYVAGALYSSYALLGTQCNTFGFIFSRAGMCVRVFHLEKLLQGRVPKM